MQTYCLSCEKHTDNINLKKKRRRRKEVFKQASKCANCVAEKSRFLKRKSNKKTRWDKINPKFLIH